MDIMKKKVMAWNWLTKTVRIMLVILYIFFYRNPHTQDVTIIQETAVVMNPDNPQELALFLYETYYPLSNEIAVYSSI